MRAKRSSTAASSKATENLQLQNAAASRTSPRRRTKSFGKPHSATKKPPRKSRPQQPAKTGVNIQRRSGFWQPDGWNKITSAKKRASTSFVGGLETDDRHCPATGCHPGPSPALAETTASWLRWDRNPVWAAAENSEAGLVGAPRSGQTKMYQTVRKQESAAANVPSGEPTACADAQSDGSEDEQWVSRSCASASCLVLVDGKEAPSVCHHQETSRARDAILLDMEANTSLTSCGEDSSTVHIECFVSSAHDGLFRSNSALKSKASSPAFSPLEDGPAGDVNLLPAGPHAA